MVHAFVPEHLLDLADYLNNHQFRSELYDLQCINRTVINRLYFASYLHAKEWILVHGEYDSLDDYTDESSSHLAIVVALRRLNQQKNWKLQKCRQKVPRKVKKTKIMFAKKGL